MSARRILFVCTGNLCRSPMARTVAENLARSAGLAMRLEFDSAGTQALQGRAAIDPRARAALERAGYKLVPHRARHVTTQDLVASDLILAMDGGHLEALGEVCEPKHAYKLRRFTDFAKGFEGEDVPDPYYGAPGGFDRVLDICEAGVRGLIVAAPTLFGADGSRPLKAPSAG